MKTRLRKGKKNFITLLMLVVIFLSSITQVVSAEKVRDFQTVTDMADLLLKEQILNIEEKANTLEMFDIALYIENKDESECSQEYTNDLSKRKYDLVFGSDYKNGVMVVFSFYEEANGYYAITYGANVEVDEREMSNIIENTYHDFSTDATWVEGAFCQCVDYVQKLEYNIIHADEIKAQKEEESKNFWNIMQKVIIGVLVLAIVYLIYQINKKEESFYESSNRLKEKITNSERNVFELQEENGKYQMQIEKLEDWRKIAKCVVPNIQEQIDLYLDTIAAKEFDKNFSNLEGFEPTVENYQKFAEASDNYEKLSTNAKELVKLNMRDILKKHDIALKEYVASAEEEIRSKLGKCKGNRHYRIELHNINDYYYGLPTPVQLLITATLLNSLHDMQSAANSDYRMHQEESSYHSNYSSSYGGNFGGGFGGGH